MPVNDVRISALLRSLVQDGSLSSADVNTLIDAAMGTDGRLTTAEKASLREALTTHQDKIQDPQSRARLAAVVGMPSAHVRKLALELERDGVIDIRDANRLIEAVRSNFVVSKDEKRSLREVMTGLNTTGAARATLRELLGDPMPTVPGEVIDLKLPEVVGNKYYVATDGHLSQGREAAASYDENGALSVYRGATALLRAGELPLASLPAEVKGRMLEHLERCFAAGQDSGPLPETPRTRMRAGAATTLMLLIESCGPADGELKAKAIDLYLRQAMAEPVAGLRASMYFNLERIGNELRGADRERLQALHDQVVPAKPPYDAWLADGKRQINVRHYAHKECWDNGNPVADYERRGYQVAETHTDESPRRWVLTKTNESAPGGPLSMRIELVESHDGIFEKMDDPNVHMILYTGHSNLGGNVSEELRLGSAERGQKLILLAMCRGKQNMFEVANRYPHAQFLTTDQPSYFSSVMTVAMGMTEAVLGMKDYTAMRAGTGSIWDDGGLSNYFFPNEARRYQHYDLDRDGIIDSRGATVDRLYDVRVQLPTGTKVDCVPRANDYIAEELDGTKVQHAVQFLNTLMTYHVDHGHHTSAFTAADMDAFLADGFFDGPLDQLVQVEKVEVDGKPRIKVRVNKALADQSAFALGALVQYEVVRQLATERNGGTFSDKDRARALLFSGEYLAYMYCSSEEAFGSIRGIARHAGVKNVDFRTLYQAIETDGHGYVTDTQMQSLLDAIK